MNVVLYSTGCPKCQVLKKKLDAKGVEYTVVDDMSIMEEKGIMSVPVLALDNHLLTFTEANDWINKIN